MASPNECARHRSCLLILLSQGFSHPNEAFHQHLLDGTYQAAVSQAHEGMFDQTPALPAVTSSFADYEALYIELFHIGKNGAPMVGLHAGDYSDLLDGQPRPEFMLDHNRWYRHFGLKVSQTDPSLDLPDHLVCQLQFLAWLSHLEAEIAPGRNSVAGYRHAQRDFIQRHVEPFVARVADGLAKARPKLSHEPQFAALGALTHALIAQTAHELALTLGPPGVTDVPLPEPDAAIPVVESWS
jgi:DMSO reductase family type II enzyme chaperone